MNDKQILNEIENKLLYLNQRSAHLTESEYRTEISNICEYINKHRYGGELYGRNERR